MYITYVDMFIQLVFSDLNINLLTKFERHLNCGQGIILYPLMKHINGMCCLILQNNAEK